MLCCHLVGPNTCNCEKYSEFGHIICFRDTCLPRECWRNMISCSLLKLPRLSGLIKFLNSIHYLTDPCIFILNWSCNFQSLFKFYSTIVLNRFVFINFYVIISVQGTSYLWTMHWRKMKHSSSNVESTSFLRS